MFQIHPCWKSLELTQTAGVQGGNQLSDHVSGKGNSVKFTAWQGVLRLWTYKSRQCMTTQLLQPNDCHVYKRVTV